MGPFRVQKWSFSGPFRVQKWVIFGCILPPEIGDFRGALCHQKLVIFGSFSGHFTGFSGHFRVVLPDFRVILPDF